MLKPYPPQLIKNILLNIVKLYAMFVLTIGEHIKVLGIYRIQEFIENDKSILAEL